MMASDPRIAQAVGFMSGMAIDVSDQDIRAAERVGDIRKRDAIQFPDLELASEMQARQMQKRLETSTSRRDNTPRR